MLMLLVSAYSFLPLAAQHKYTFLLTGASFGVPENSWFEMGCEALDATPINKSVSGEAIRHTAISMYNGNFYSTAELDAVDVFIIMHVHNLNVADTAVIKEDYTQYTIEDINRDYAAAYDYVIKKYRNDCFKLKNDPESKYYGTKNGKPALIVFCTHWHDARTIYNSSIRILAEKWGFPLIRWDENIGFTKNVLDLDGKQPSLKYCRDTETIKDITYGWHPVIGKGEYIQEKLAEIFIDELKSFLGKFPPSRAAEIKYPNFAHRNAAYEE